MVERKIIIELTVAESIEVYRCLEGKMIELSNQGQRLQRKIDISGKKNCKAETLEDVQDNLSNCTTQLGFYRDLMHKFKKIL